MPELLAFYAVKFLGCKNHVRGSAHPAAADFMRISTTCMVGRKNVYISLWWAAKVPKLRTTNIKDCLSGMTEATESDFISKVLILEFVTIYGKYYFYFSELLFIQLKIFCSLPISLKNILL